MRRSELLKLAKPILFNTEMVRAIMDGRKTVTRRIIKEKIDCEFLGFCTSSTQSNKEIGNALFGEINYLRHSIKPKYKVGDILYVRETWQINPIGFEETPPEIWKIYRASHELPDSCTSWRPSIHMPKKYARTFLKITGVRVERLQDITINGIYHEGAIGQYICEYPDLQEMYKGLAYTVWISLWNRTIKKSELSLYGWDANPYVFVYEFEKVEVNDG